MRVLSVSVGKDEKKPKGENHAKGKPKGERNMREN